MNRALGDQARPRAGVVHLWSQRAMTPTRVTDCIEGDITLIVHSLSAEHPPHADYYIVGSLDVAAEREAARLGALPVVLPAAQEWLHIKITQRCAAGENVIIAMRWSQ